MISRRFINLLLTAAIAVPAVPVMTVSSEAQVQLHELLFGRRPRRERVIRVEPEKPRPAPRAATSPAAHAVFDLLDTDRDGVVRRAEFFDAVGAVNRVVPPERRIDGDSVWGLLDCNGDGELERNELERGLRI